MPTLHEIKRRIGSVKSTQQITRAMKMVSAAKLRKAQQRLAQARPFVDELNRMLSSLSEKKGGHPFFEPREGGNVCYVLITADRGLCGSFNSNLVRTAHDELQKAPPNKRCLMAIGRKGYDYFRRRDYPIAGSHTDFFNQLDFTDAETIADKIIDRFVNKEIDQVFVVYNEYHTIVQQKIVVKQFLPIELPYIVPPLPSGMIIEPRPKKLLDALLPMSLRHTLFRMLLESFTAEQGARMAAMEQAADNADEMISGLVLFYNKTRQAAITKELGEIVGGAEALRG
jgi:F-type H+-transporting ATPase subunit gamma